ncbi:MAG: glutaminyl-peptide cyclotransferase, partial [Bacteroidetes bacterium]
MQSYLLISRFFFFVFMTFSCGPGDGTAEKKPVQAEPQVRLARLVKPSYPVEVTIGENAGFAVEVPDSIRVDSLQVFLGGTHRQTLEQGLDGSVSTGGELPGRASLRLRVFYGDGKSENISQQIILLSDIDPVEYTYRVVNEYPHNEDAYTQGLEYEEGWIYEGTGNKGSSTLRRVELETGKVARIHRLEDEFFGEGITLFGSRIYQLTYRSQVGFIYDKETFEELQKVYYQNREGWGLANNGKELIMSDGTHVIYFLDPDLFTINRQIEVYDNEGRADSLNELEYIEGKIWANRYYTDEIVIIDPATGKVEGRIDLKGILKAVDRKPTTDVLNGIAWD